MTNPQVGAQQEEEARREGEVRAFVFARAGRTESFANVEDALFIGALNAYIAFIERQVGARYTELVEAQWLALTEIDAMARALIETEDGEITPARVRTVARFMRERALAAALAHLEEAEA